MSGWNLACAQIRHLEPLPFKITPVHVVIIKINGGKALFDMSVLAGPYSDQHKVGVLLLCSYLEEK